MARKQADAKPRRSKRPLAGEQHTKAQKRGTAPKKRGAGTPSAEVPRAPTAGYCARTLDAIAWPPRHDGHRCHGLHRELPAPKFKRDRKRSGNPLPEVRDAKQRTFLAALSHAGNISQACRLADIGRTTVYRWLEDDADFVKARDMALEVYADLIDEEMHARGVEGWDEPQFGKIDIGRDGIVGYVRKKSDAVLLRLAAGVRPEKYGKQLHDVRGKDGAPLGGDLSKLSEQELLEYRELVAKISGGGTK